MANMLRFPAAPAWMQLGLVLLVFAVIATVFGTATGFFRFALADELAAVLRIAAIAFVLPALLEEIVFRGPLIWLAERRSRWFGAGAVLSLTLFVVWHPINGMFLVTEARDIFSDWRFLTLATLLGMMATWLAVRTRSIWPPVVFHWLVVVGWKAFFGGPQFLS